MTDRYGQLANFTLKLTDLVLMLTALVLGIVINYAPTAPVPLPAFAFDFLSTRIKVGNALLGGLLLITWYLAFYLQGVYRSHRLSGLSEELGEVARAIFFASAALLIVGQLGKWHTVTIGTTASIGLIGLILVGRAMTKNDHVAAPTQCTDQFCLRRAGLARGRP